MRLACQSLNRAAGLAADPDLTGELILVGAEMGDRSDPYPRVELGHPHTDLGPRAQRSFHDQPVVVTERGP